MTTVKVNLAGSEYSCSKPRASWKADLQVPLGAQCTKCGKLSQGMTVAFPSFGDQRMFLHCDCDRDDRRELVKVGPAPSAPAPPKTVKLSTKPAAWEPPMSQIKEMNRKCAFIDLAREVARMAPPTAIEIGEWLLAVKPNVPRGKWLPWLALRFPNTGESTLSLYMTLAKDRAAIEEKFGIDLSPVEIPNNLSQIPNVRNWSVDEQAAMPSIRQMRDFVIELHRLQKGGQPALPAAVADAAKTTAEAASEAADSAESAEAAAEEAKKIVAKLKKKKGKKKNPQVPGTKTIHVHTINPLGKEAIAWLGVQVDKWIDQIMEHFEEEQHPAACEYIGGLFYAMVAELQKGDTKLEHSGPSDEEPEPEEEGGEEGE